MKNNSKTIRSVVAVKDHAQGQLQLKKHVAVIHSSNKLSLLQRKIANALLYNAYHELHEKDEHVIHIASLCKLINYASHDYKTIKKALINLLATVLEWNLVDGERLDKADIWNASSIIADASIDGAICTYSYSNKMRQLLYRPEMYGRLDMAVQAKFQSSYGLALYENCNRFQDIGQTPWFDMNRFRQLMGVQEGQYKIFRDFKTRVLDKAIKEVNTYSAISVEPKFKKLNRQVVSIQFLIANAASHSSANHKNNSEQYIISAMSTQDERLDDLLKNHFGFSKKQITQTLTIYEEGYIREKIALITASSSYQKGIIANLAKYLLSALKEDYQPSKKSPKVITAKQTDSKKLEAYRRYQDKEILKWFQNSSRTLRNKLIPLFEKYLGKSMYWDIYLRDGVEHVLIQDQLCMFIRQTKQEVLQHITSYDEWLLNETI